jgi:hypothetical protein
LIGAGGKAGCEILDAAGFFLRLFFLGAPDADAVPNAADFDVDVDDGTLVIEDAGLLLVEVSPPRIPIRTRGLKARVRAPDDCNRL